MPNDSASESASPIVAPSLVMFRSASPLRHSGSVFETAVNA